MGVNGVMSLVKIQRRLIEAGVDRLTDTVLTSVGSRGVLLSDVYTGRTRDLVADAVVMVTARLPRDALLLELVEHQERGEIATVRGVGDCFAPGTIAAAVWSGRRAAEEFEGPEQHNDDVLFLRETTELAVPRVSVRPELS